MATPVYSILIDFGTKIVLAGSSHVAAVEFLLGCSPDKEAHVSFVQHPNYTESLFLRSIPLEELPLWTWDGKNRLFVPTDQRHLTDTVRARSRLAMSRLNVVSRIINNLNMARNPVNTGIIAQEVVYLTKRLEARRFKDLGYDESYIFEYPFVLQYAELVGISPKQAADDILLKASLDDQILEKTEFLRLKYFNRIRKENDPNKMEEILVDFYRDCYVYSLS